MKYIVEVRETGLGITAQTKEFQTEIEALNFITNQIDEDILYGDDEEYDYYLNGAIMNR